MNKAPESLPEGWCWTLVYELGDVTGGVTKNSGRGSRPIRLPYLRVANVYANELRLEDVAEIDASVAEAERARLRLGDLLVVEGNGSIDQIGRVACWNGSIDPCLHQNHLIKVRFEPVVLGRWVLHWLLAPAGRREIVRVASSTSGLYTLSLSKVADLKVPLAPLPEQSRIVDAIETQLTRLDAAVAALERVRANLKRYRASVLKAAVEGRLVPTEAELARQEGRDYEPATVLLQRILAERRRRWEEAEIAAMKAKGKTPKDDKWKAKYEEPVAPDTTGLPELPEGWCWASPAQLATPESHAIKAGPFGSALKKDFYSATGYKIYGQEQVIRGDHAYGDYYIDEARYESLSTCSVRPGDILISLVGTIGRLLVLPSDAQPGIINPRLIKLTLEPRLISPNFFRVFFCSPSAQTQLSRESQGATMNILNLSIVKRLAVPVPPRREQERIVLETDRLDSIGLELGVQAEYGVARTTRLRQSILKWAFEGKLVDQDPNDEPASVLLERIRAERGAVTAKDQAKTKRNGRKRNAA